MKFSFPVSEKAKYLASRLPSDWPSYLHSKCSVRTCYFPNPPQAAEGTYNCQGCAGRATTCKGTYYVSHENAMSAVKVQRNVVQRHEEAIRKKKAAELERRKLIKHQRDEEATRQAAEELAAKYEEQTRLKEITTGSKSNNPPSGLTRRTAHRIRPIGPKQDPTIGKQHHASSTNDEFCSLPWYPPVVNHYYRTPIDQYPRNHSPQMPLQIPSCSQQSKFATHHYSPASHGHSSHQYQPQVLSHQYQSLVHRIY